MGERLGVYCVTTRRFVQDVRVAFQGEPWWTEDPQRAANFAAQCNESQNARMQGMRYEVRALAEQGGGKT